MRDLVTWVAVNPAGNGDATLAPSFLHYIDRSGNARPQPFIVNFGNGVFGFVPTDTDVAVGTIFIIDNSASALAALRYSWGVSHEQADQLQPLLLANSTSGALWSGAAPTIGAYKNDAGANQTPPTVTPLVAPYLYLIQPSVTDSANGVHFRCDAAAGSVFAGATAYLFGNFIAPAVQQDKFTWLALDSNGNPDATATPTITVYASRTGTAITPPTVLNVGLGLFAFNPPSVDTTTGVVFLVDNGAGRQGRYFSGVSTLPTDPFDQVLVTDGTGALWTGAAPSFTTYKDPGGNARLKPTPVAIAGAYLYTLLPSAADLLAGVVWSVDGAANALPSRFAGNFLSVTALAGTPQGPVATVVSSSLQSFAQQQDFGTDISTFPDLDPSFSLIQGNRVLAEALVRRWITVRGSLFDAPDFGCDVREYVNEAGIMGNIAKSTLYRMKNVMEAEAKKDQRCANCIVNLDYNQNTQTMIATAEIDTAGGPFKLELAITAVSVALLKLG